VSGQLTPEEEAGIIIKRTASGEITDSRDPILKQTRPDGQQEGYIVLSAEERAKGFVRPVRDSYIHLKCGSLTRMGYTIAETYARNPKFYGGTFCVKCSKHFPLKDEQGNWAFKWDDNSGQGVGE
jgi:hypothetical protein